MKVREESMLECNLGLVLKGDVLVQNQGQGGKVKVEHYFDLEKIVS